jgi:hypothetical protein
MDVEQLKLIAETIKALGANGTSAFIWYLAFVYGSKIVTGVLWGGVVLTISHLGFKAMTRTVDAAKALKK